MKKKLLIAAALLMAVLTLFSCGDGEGDVTTPEPGTSAPAPETKAPETQATETQAPETQAPETKAPETQAPETQAPETQAPETQAPETQAPETQAPETKPAAPVFTALSIQTMPAKTSYYTGDLLNTEGLVLNAIYSDGSAKPVKSGFTCSPSTLKTAGTQSVTVTYEGKNAVFTVNVTALKLSSLAITAKPAKLSYTVGDTLDATGLKLEARYNNGKAETVTTGFTCAPTQLSTVGTQSIVVAYQGLNAKFDVEVKDNKPAVTLTSVAVTANPTKTEYFVGDTLDTAGTVVTGTYSDGTTAAVTGWTADTTVLNDAGVKTVTVTYEGKTCTFTVNVTALQLTSLSIVSQPAKTEYNLGETLDTTGLKLQAVYNSGKTEEITQGFVCTPTVLNQAGAQAVTVVWGGLNTQFTVNVTAPAAAEPTVGGVASKTTVLPGETFTVDFVLSGNPGVMAVQGKLNLSAGVTKVSESFGSLIPNVAPFVWLNSSGDVTADGTLYSVTVKAPEKANDGDILTVALNIEMAVNFNEQAVTFVSVPATVTVNNPNQPKLIGTASGTEAAAGEDVTVTFDFSNNPGVMAIQGSLQLSQGLTKVSETYGSLIPKVADFLWMNSTGDVTADGTLYTVTVKVGSGLAAGTELNVALNVILASNFDEQPVFIQTVPAKITVK